MQLDPLAQSASKEERRVTDRVTNSPRRRRDGCIIAPRRCGSKRIKMTADLAVLRRHWMKRVMARYKGGVLYAMRKNMWNCLGQWARSQDADDYDLTVNVGLDGRYCVRAGGRANETHA